MVVGVERALSRETEKALGLLQILGVYGLDLYSGFRRRHRSDALALSPARMLP